MGWTNLHRPPGMTDRKFFEREFPNMLGKYGEIVACATIRGVFYAAVRDRDNHPDTPGQTWALVVLLRRTRGHYNFWYREMSETDLPLYYNAPQAVLDALTPTTHEDALTWRARCQQRIDDRKRLTRGTTITFTQPIPFADNVERSVLRFVVGSTFEGADDGVLVRIPNWQDHDYTIGEPAEPVAA